MSDLFPVVVEILAGLGELVLAIVGVELWEFVTQILFQWVPIVLIIGFLWEWRR